MQRIVQIILVSSFAIICFLAGGGAMQTVSAEEDYESLRRFSQILDLVEQYYVKEVPQSELIDGALKGMLESLDPHSTMMTVEEFKDIQETTSGEFFGVGIEITTENGQILVISPIEGTPASRAGIRSGDIIVAVDGEYTIDMTLTNAVSRMRGERGTEVELLILRKGEAEPIRMNLVRDAIPYTSVSSVELETGYYWIRVARFSERTTTELEEVLEDAQKSGEIKGIILDLRNNPGGLLIESVTVSDMFLKEGLIVSMRGREGEEANSFSAKDQESDVMAPMVVLVNAGSASASEIVAGALRDNNRAILIGEKTFGKGSVQNIIPLSDGSGLKLTVARYYTPSGRSIQAEGISPDFEVLWESPKSDDGKIDLPYLREKDLNKHLEDENNEDVTQMSEEAIRYLSNDNQLRMALQFVKSLPLLGKVASGMN